VALWAALVTGPAHAAFASAALDKANSTIMMAPALADPARPAPPSNVTACDRPNDDGGAIVVSWTPSPDDNVESGSVTGYVIYRAVAQEGPFQELGLAEAGSSHFIDTDARTGMSYFYQVAAVAGHLLSEPLPTAAASSAPQWLNWERWNLLLIGLLLVGAITYGIRTSRRPPLTAVAAPQGKTAAALPSTLRPLPGLEALDAAINKAAEVDRPVLFVLGSEDLNDIQTLAGLSVLEQVARRTAQQNAPLQVPHFHSLVMTAADDVLQRGYLAAGWPERYDRDANYYVSDEQFGFVAGVSGMMARQKPAACFYFGSFYAESLALAEMGQTIGAVQIAGTGQGSQLPFLLTACDHVLIGEELFAAAAYLSGDPRQLGCLRGQDLGKLLAVGAIGAGCLLATLTALAPSTTLNRITEALMSVFRTGQGG
jgi:hypothetical protein